MDWLRIMRLSTIHLVCWLSLLCNLALAQFDISEGLTGSTSFPNVALTSLGNLAIFLTCLVSGRLYAEMGARDLVDWIAAPRLLKIDEFGLTICRFKSENGHGRLVLNLRSAQVVMLSKDKPSCSMRQFMKYTSRVYGVPSIQLQSLPLSCSGQVDVGIRNCCGSDHACNCIVFQTKEDITMLLAEQMPRTLKQLPDSKCLLPCRSCLENGCHGYDGQELWHVEDVEENAEEVGRKNKRELKLKKGAPKVWEDGRKNKRELKLKKGAPKVWPVPAVCQILDEGGVGFLEQPNSCICIPTYPAEDDKWTEMLITTLKTKDKDSRGVITLASDALQKYIAQTGECEDEEQYGTLSFIVPRFAEGLVNIILTVWLRVDGFSSALISRRAIRDYIVDSRGRGIACNAFVAKAQVKSNAENTDVCQLLTFRGSLLNFGTFSIIIPCVNLLCSFTWAVLIALEGGKGKWYEPEAMPLSEPRVYVIMIAIVIDLALSCYIGLGLIRKSRGLMKRSRTLGATPRTFWDKLVYACEHMVYIFAHGVTDPSAGGGVPSDGSEAGFRWMWKNSLTSIYTIRAVGGYVIGACEIWGVVSMARGHFKAEGRWFYGAVQALVWLRWGISTLVVKEYSPEYNRDMARRRVVRTDHLPYACTFLLNAIFVGVRGNWKWLSYM